MSPVVPVRLQTDMATATVSRWAKRYVIVSGLFLIVWQTGLVADIPRRAAVTVGVYGFVLHMVFGKAYSLIPSYFDRELAWPAAPAVQFPLVVVGAGGLTGAALWGGPTWVRAGGAALWCLGIAVFVGTLGWTIRDNPTGRETATSEANAERRPVDRLANGVVPVAFGYLLAGSYETVAVATGLPTLFDGYVPRVTHLLAAGTAGLLVFALGFRLLPRFMVALPPRPLVGGVLTAGAVGPGLLAARLGGGPLFRVGAVIQAGAVVGFAGGVAILFRRSDRRRIGFYGVLAGAVSGVVAVGFGLWFAFEGVSPGFVVGHLRANLLGFLGLTIVGIAYQFYPPAVGAGPGASDRTAIVSIALLAGGLSVQLLALAAGWPPAVTFGEALSLSGAVLYLYLLIAVFAAR